MEQSGTTTPNDKQPDVGSCRVCKMADGQSVCMMNRHCSYALPFGNICSHPMVGLMTNIGACVK